VEGASPSEPLLRHSENRVSHFVDFTLQVTYRDPHYDYVMQLEPIITLAITRRPIGHVVTDSIEFDRQSRGRAIKIEHIRTYGMLPAKHRFAIFAPAEPAPKSRFRH
jgi:hypothetical protein